MVAVLVAAAGWWFSADLLRLSMNLSATNPLLEAQCGGGDAASSDCKSVLRTRRALLILDEGSDTTADGFSIPWTVLGAAYFAFIGLWYLFVGPPTRNRWAWHVPVTVVVSVGLIVSIDLVTAMAFELRRWCGGCTMVHIFNGILVFLTFLAIPWRRSPRGLRHPAGMLGPAALTACCFAGLLHLAGVNSLQSRRMQAMLTQMLNDVDYARWNYNRQPVREIPILRDEVWMGSPNAEHTLVMFVDYACSACRSAHRMVERQLERYSGKLRVAVRNWPKDHACNPKDPTGGHPGACAAAAAAEAARELGQGEMYQRMRRLLYDRQRDLETNRFEDWARELGLDAAAFRSAMDGPSVQARLRADIELGQQLGIEAVPTLWLDGRKFENWRLPAVWQVLLGEPEVEEPSKARAKPRAETQSSEAPR